MPTPGQIPRDHLEATLRVARHALRYWWVALAVLGIGIAGTFAIAKLRPKQYRSEAVVNYREGLQFTQQEGVSARRIGNRLKEALLARNQLVGLIEEMKLHPRLVRAGRLGDAVEETRLAITFKFVDNDIFAIGFTGDTPEEAQRVTARLTQLLVENNARSRTDQATGATSFIKDEKKRAAADLGAKEAELARFVASHPEFANELTTAGAALRATTRNETRAGAQSAGTEESLAALEREETELRQRLATMGAPAGPRETLLAARNDAEARLKAAARELADRRGRFTEQHPDVQAALEAYREADAASRRATAALAAAPTAEPPSAIAARLAEVQADLARKRREPRARPAPAPASTSVDKAGAQRLVSLDTEWARLNREVALAREQYQQLEEKQFIAGLTETSATTGKTAQILVVDPAFLPANPIGMRTGRLLILGFVATFLLALGAALLLALLDDRIYDQRDVERLAIAPVLMDMSRRPIAADLTSGAERGTSSTPPLFAPMDEARLLGSGDSDAEDEAVEGSSGSAVVVPLRATNPRGDDRDRTAVAGCEDRTELALRTDQGMELVAEITQDFFAEGAGHRGGASPADPPPVIRVHRHAPTAQPDPRLVMLVAPDSPGAASFRVLRHRLAERSGKQAILVTSPQREEGKTICAVNLALALGEAGRARVILLEANFRSPSLARIMGFKPLVCFSQQLAAHRTERHQPWIVSEALTPWLHTLAVVSEGVARPIVDGTTLARCVEDLRRAGYDYIVIDSPSVLDSADVNVIEECADGILVTMRSGHSRARVLREAVDQVGSKKLLGVALLSA